MTSAYDGQWNPRVGAYILPPLIGLPFHEMVKNGEGARHANDKKYYTLIVVHAVFMSLPFLFLIPAAIFSARFKKRENPLKAIQLHLILNTASAVFLTIGFVAGWFAVSKGEWGKNPHHLIGVALFGGVLLQGVVGVYVRARERNKLRKLGQVGLKSMLHMWFGRALWLLGLAQIPLGLYLYGSPLVLFIVYAAITFLLFVIYFVFEYVSNRRTAKYQPAPGGDVGSPRRGAHARTSDGSHHSNHRRNQSHSGVSYTEMTETTHPAPTVTPGTFDTRTSYDGQEGTEFLSQDGGDFGNDVHRHDMPATPKVGRLSAISRHLGSRFRRNVSSLDSHALGSPISLDASTRPPTGSTTNRISGGLHAPPNNRPPLSSIGGQIATVGALDQHHFRRNPNNDPLKDTRPGSNRAEMPGGGGGGLGLLPTIPGGQTTTNTTTNSTTNPSSAVSPVSPASTSAFVQRPQMPRPQSEVSSLSSDRPGAKYAGGHLFSPLLPPLKAPPNTNKQQDTPMPPSPFGDLYTAPDEGPASPPPHKNPTNQTKYTPLLLPSQPPRVPLPMPPSPHQQTSPRQSRRNNNNNHHNSHDRIPSDTSTQPDAVIRIPLSGHSDTINIPAGELIRNTLPAGEQPQVSVQVKVDRVGRSVTVRRLPEEEAAVVRAARGRERAERARERERGIERERRRSIAAAERGSGGGGGGGGSEVSGGTGVTTVSSGTLPHGQSQNTNVNLRPVAQTSTSTSTNNNQSSSLRNRLPPPPPPPAAQPQPQPQPQPQQTYSDEYSDSGDGDSYTSSDSRQHYDAGAGAGGGAANPNPTTGARAASNAGRESVVSAAPTDDAEAEEKIRERRREKRREERKEGGLTSAELKGGGGTYYGAGAGAGQAQGQGLGQGQGGVSGGATGGAKGPVGGAAGVGTVGSAQGSGTGGGGTSLARGMEWS